ncbi:hypothetical protein [Fictibacillus phosphorivorans]|uniref:hypothetical protein n=1 Tax=Fictibacillus phosphorivorans TaxID=1221500 RepID=UPI001292F72C|nr:hypothetical protein [Fictibacillus phosphorivorans]MQR96027.1 hypothetical protein [Fictibacillus phosphorivorans]
MFRKGTYASYKGKEYKFTEAEEQEKIELISYDPNETEKGFVLYSPGVFIKSVEVNDVDEMYYIDPLINYEGEWFKGTILGNGQLIISTSDAKIAEKLGFERKDKYLYTKNVEWEEVDIIESKISFELS